MLKKLLNIFFNSSGRLEQEEINNNTENNEVLASIRYSVKTGSPDVVIDIELQDYDDTSASGLCNILDILCEDFCYAETINMIRLALTQDNQEELLIKIFTHISQDARDKIVKSYEKIQKDEPCIKPSDMLK